MKRWSQRPTEIRNLFNPAFCGLILFRAMQGYEEVEPCGMHFSLALLILPLCLHKDSREVITGNSRSYLLKITETNPQIQVGFADRVTAMLPYTFEGFGLLMERGCISVTDDGRLQTVPGKVRKSVTGTDETKSCQRAARFAGKEFARIVDRATIYTTFGIRP
ncbi:hypothetical protein SAMN04487965_0074 [Microbulbifer donghaiensis]|uniref:Uncharacterized protein n=1 Tax=Microbulbifer donghaiensis TaxID=494016 RepID=A0A1M4U6R7_9GAMM|nr:three component ABC system middle component [Microbulbifer donghaiensis]SHE52338.1 hypothetical protein SAMN04487965_0074 [Microbulbifer donghaiensis]